MQNNQKISIVCHEEFSVDDDILTIEEVAKILRVSERTVYDWAQRRDSLRKNRNRVAF